MKWAIAMIFLGLLLIASSPAFAQVAWWVDHNGIINQLSESGQPQGADVMIWLMAGVMSVIAPSLGITTVIFGLAFALYPTMRPDFMQPKEPPHES